MSWSTREIAELAGTSLRSVRHYHQIGLLPEPERLSNGYKQYGVAHLIRLLRIKRLADLGFGLPQIAELGDGDEHPEEALRAFAAELGEQIERLRRARAEVVDILAVGGPTDRPAVLAAGAKGPLSETDRQVTTVMGRLLGEQERATWAELLTEDARMQSDQDFEDLPADADDATRAELAERMARDLATLRERYPGIDALGAADPQHYRRTMEKVSRELYNPAQLDVQRRMVALHTAAAATAARRGARPGTAPPPGTS